MVDVMEWRDIERDVVNTVMLYKGQPTYVHKVEPDCTVNITIMKTQKKQVVPFNWVDFSPPNMRLGMLNAHKHAIFLSRIPYRKMIIGYAAGNLNGEFYSKYDHHDPELPKALVHAKKLNTKEMANTMLGEYPTFQAARKFVLEHGGAMAFDRQFAITKDLEIIYKTKKVGVLPKNCTKVERIQWDEGCEHLAILIGDNCEQSLRNLRQA